MSSDTGDSHNTGDAAESGGTGQRRVLAQLRPPAAFALCLVGAVWFTQGMGWLKGSFMTGDSTWLVIGLVLMAVGLGLLVWHVRSAKSRSPEGNGRG